MPAFERLILVRHGQCALEAEGARPGLLDTELTREGRRMADDAGRAIASQSVPVHEVLSSPLARATATARTIAQQALGQPSVRVVWQLSDRHLGAWSGRAASEISSDETGLDFVPPALADRVPRPSATRYALEQWPQRNRPQPESIRDVLERVRGFWLRHLYSRPGTGAVVVVSHDVPLRALRLILEGGSEEDLLEDPLRPGDVVAYDTDGHGPAVKTCLWSGETGVAGRLDH